MWPLWWERIEFNLFRIVTVYIIGQHQQVYLMIESANYFLNKVSWLANYWRYSAVKICNHQSDKWDKKRKSHLSNKWAWLRYRSRFIDGIGCRKWFLMFDFFKKIKLTFHVNSSTGIIFTNNKFSNIKFVEEKLWNTGYKYFTVWSRAIIRSHPVFSIHLQNIQDNINEYNGLKSIIRTRKLTIGSSTNVRSGVFLHVRWLDPTCKKLST